MSDYSFEDGATPTETVNVLLRGVQVATLTLVGNSQAEIPQGELVVLKFPYSYREFWQLTKLSEAIDTHQLLVAWRATHAVLTFAEWGVFTTERLPAKPQSDFAAYALSCNGNVVGYVANNQQFLTLPWYPEPPVSAKPT